MVTSLSRRRHLGALATATLVSTAVVTLPSIVFMPARPASAAVELTLTEADLVFIMNQIKIAERTALRDAAVLPDAAAGVPVADQATLSQAPETTPIVAIQDEWLRVNGTTITADQAALQPWGLRQVDGRNNNISDPTRSNWGASDEIFRRTTPHLWRDAGIDGPSGTIATGNYQNRANNAVRDYHPRLVSNLVSDQTETNPAAVAAANSRTVLDADGSLQVPNVAPNPLAAPYNGVFSLFGQYFDHGLDLVNKSSTEFVVIPLVKSDPLVKSGAAASAPFMMLNRTKLDANGDATNAVTPWIDQNQTYTSHPAHQVFLRQYAMDALGRPVATGKFLDGGRCGAGALAHVCDIPTWAEVKASALQFLGIQLDDTNVHDVPLVLTDQYGRFIRSASGFPMVLMQDGTWHSGTPSAPISTANAVGAGHAFLDDIAHGADPSRPGYNAALLDSHFVTGDGRGNENIGLTSIHLVFHAEHNRLVEDVKRIVCDPATGAALRADWGALAAGVRANPCAVGAVWDGERLFQASKFVNEMEYQHLIFDGFARKVQPAIKPFASYNPNIQPDVTAEFAHAVYRYGHSQLNGTIRRQFDGPNSAEDELKLLNAFLNPAAFARKPGGGAIGSAAESAGAVFQGMTNQRGNEIDEFVVNTLRNNLLGLPLDLPTLNMTRARDAGTQTLNGARAAFFAATNGDESLRPYSDWWAFRDALRHDRSIVNFIAAYGKEHPNTTTPGTRLQDLRAAAETDPDLIVKLRARAELLLTDAAFMLGIVPGTLNDAVPTRFDSGVDGIDLWIGGLAERPQIVSGGMLGSTFDHVFKSQMEYLQNGDRFYYLARTAGMNLGAQLGLNTWADMVMRNTTAYALPFDAFAYPTKTVLMPDALNMRQTSEITPMGTLLKLTGTCDPTRNVVISGTSAMDAFEGGCGDDTLRGLGSDDYLRGGQGNDNFVGGAGDDMMFDGAGLTIFSGEAGNDYMVGSGPDADTFDGGTGDDIVVGGLSGAVVTAGGGNDFAHSGNAADVVSGEDGHDWLEGGTDADLLTGDVGPAAGLITNAAGRDVLIGGMDNDLMDGGDMMDVAVDWQGIDSFLGGFGFDWFSYSTPTPSLDKAANVDLNVLAVPPVNVFPTDLFAEVEGVSGGARNDIIRGDSLTSLVPVPPIPGGTDDTLSASDIDVVAGLRARVLANTPAAVTGTNRWAAGNILLGGGGADTLEGRAGDDVIHGNAQLRVYLSVPGNLPNAGTTTLASVTIKPDPVTAGRVLVDSLTDLKPWLDNRSLRVGDLIVRRIVEDNPLDTGLDIGVFSNPRANYSVSYNASTGVTTVVDNSPAGTLAIDGTDFLRGVERLTFVDTSLNVTTTPTNVRVQAGSVTTTDGLPTADLRVSWSDVNNENGYTALAYTTADGDTLAGSCSAGSGTTNCTISGLARGTTYYVQVHSYNNVGRSLPPASRTAGSTTVNNIPAPTTVTVSNIGATGLTVNWSGVTNATGYVARAYNAEGVARSCTGGSTARSCSITGLTAGRQHWVTVASQNDLGEGIESTRVATQTLPPAPTGVSATVVSSTAVDVRWTALTGVTPAITTYTATAYTTSTGTTVARRCTASPPAVTCPITGLTAGLTYWVAVSTTNGLTGPDSTRVSVTLPIAPLAPTGVNPTVTSDTSVSVSWAAVTNTTVTSYTAKAYSAATGGTVVGTCPATAPTTNCSISGLSAGTQYWIAVSATGTPLVGEGPDSTRVSVITTGPPTAPTNVRQTGATTSSVTVAWNAVTANPAVSSYTVTVVGTAAGCTVSTTSCTISGLASNTTYSVVVTAFNGRTSGGSSPVSVATNAMTASAPRVLTPTFASRTSEQLTVQWRRPLDATGAMIGSYVMQVWSASSGGSNLASCTVGTTVNDTADTLYTCVVLIAGRARDQRVWVQVAGMIGSTLGNWSPRIRSA